MKRKICFVTGTRAEFGLLQRLIIAVASAPGLAAQIIATGTHLSPEHGNTYREIEAAGLEIDCKLEMLLDASTPSGITKSMGVQLIGLADAYARLRPDIIVLLGDRYEALGAATAALIAGIPVAHIHGGEVTEGAFDESIRHAITKLSHLHFVAAEEYSRRVLQMGESPEHVFLVGGLGVDAIRGIELLDRPSLEVALDFHLGDRSLLVTFHPETLEKGGSCEQVVELLAALHKLQDTQLIFTMPNADPGSREVRQLITDFIDSHPNAKGFSSLGQLKYLSCLKHVDGVVGNSSSGLAEAPTFGTGTVNIGMRQKGRLRAASVIDCPPARNDILRSIERLYDPDFQEVLASVSNPYGDGGASDRILEVLSSCPIGDICRKPFRDVNF